MSKDLIDNITIAVSNGRTDIVRSLIEACEQRGDDYHSTETAKKFLNAINNEHGTLLHLATKLDNADIVRTLLSAGADPSVQNQDGETPYDLLATERMSTVYAEELLKASAHSDLERMQKYLEAGVSVNVRDSPTSGNTPLHWAASYGSVKSVQCLLDNGADVNATNAEEATPLHDAVHAGDKLVIEKLLFGGANPLIKARKGKFADKTPLDLAAGDQRMMNLLMSFSSHFIPNDKSNHADGPHNRSASLESLSSVQDGLTPSLSRLSIISSCSPVRQTVSINGPQASELATFPPVMTVPPPLVTNSCLHLLWPQPQKIVQTDGPSFIPQKQMSAHVVECSNGVSAFDVSEIWNHHKRMLQSLGYTVVVEGSVPIISASLPKIICHVSSSLFDRNESYRIIISSTQLRILASDLAGLYFGISTTAQLFRLHHGEDGIPPLYIHDWPSLHHRGVLIDMSPEARIPSLDTLKGHISTLAALKMNQLHFYVKFSAKDGWQIAYCNREIMELDEYCRQRSMTLIPAMDTDSETTYADVHDLYEVFQDFMACFRTSQIVHIGPYLANFFVESLEDRNPQEMWKLLPLSPYQTIFLSVQGLHHKPHLLQMLPLTVVLVEFGHQDHDYDSPCRTMMQCGITACVCTGTATWNSIAGCSEAAITNIYRGAQAADSNQLLGLIVAEWAGLHHHPALCFSWPGLIIAAGLSWNPSTHWDYLHSRLPELINHFVVLDSEGLAGQLIVELGKIETYLLRLSRSQNEHDICGLPDRKGSLLHRLLVDPDSVNLERLTVDIFQRVVRHLKKYQLDLQKVNLECIQGGEVLAEIQLGLNLLMFACRLGKVLVSTGLNPNCNMGVAVINVGVANLPPTTRTDLANRLLSLIEQFRAVWLSRNLPCGLHTSLLLFNSVLAQLIPDQTHSRPRDSIE